MTITSTSIASLAVIPAPVVERLGWVLVHSVWQFALVALAALAILALTRRCSSELRYRLLLTCMLLLVAAPVGTWLLLPAQPVSTELATGSVVPAAAIALEPVPFMPHVPDTDFEPGAESAWLEAEAVTLPPAAEPPSSWLAIVVWTWGLGVVLFSIRPIVGWRTVQRLKRVGTSPVDESVRAAAARVIERLPLKRSVQVLQSTLVEMPLIVGWFRPVILLPVSLIAGLPVSQLEAILAHELAHVRRHDYIVNLLQIAVETLFFYHPAVWWLSWRVRSERENCCDDAAVRVTGDRVEYGRALLALEDLRGAHPALALGVRSGSLLVRVRRVLRVEEPRPPRRANGFAILCAAAAIALLAGLWAGANQAGEDEAVEEADEAPAAVEADTDDEPSVTSPEVATDRKWSRFAPGTDVVDHVEAEEVHLTVVGTAGESIAGFELITNQGLSLGKSDETGDLRFNWPAGTQRALLGYHSESHPWFGAPHTGEVLTIQLEPKERPEPIPGSKRLTVRILDSRTAEPVPGVTVTADQWEGPRDEAVASAVTNEDGIAELTGLDFLQHRLRLSAEEQVPYIGDRRYPTAEEEQVVILVDRACQLTLRAVDVQTGAGIPGVQFDRERALGEFWAQLIVPDNLGGNRAAYEKMTTDEDGYFRCLVGPETWSYMLHRRPPGYTGIVPIDGRQEVEIETPVGGHVEFTFQLVPEGETVSENGENPTPRKNWNPHTPPLIPGMHRRSQTIPEGTSGTLEIEVIANETSAAATQNDADDFTEAERAAIEALKQRGLTLNAGTAAFQRLGVEEVTARTLNASGVLLTDSDLALLEQMPLLKAVVLFEPVTDDGRVSGPSPISDDGLKHLRHLVSIERLELSYTKIGDAGVAHLQPLTTLRYLGLQHTGVTDDGIPALRELISLEELDLDGTAVSDAGLAELATLSALQSLEISKTRVADAGLPVLAQLKNVRRLRLGGAAITDAGIAHVAKLTGLQELLLHETAISDEGVAEISKMRQLTTLVLQGGTYTDEGLKQLQSLENLESLSLSSLQITDAGLQHIASLKSLKSVYVIAPEATEAGVAALREALPEASVRSVGVRN